MIKKILLFPIISILCFSSLNFPLAADAKDHGRGHFREEGRSFNNHHEHFRNNFYEEEEKSIVIPQRHIKYYKHYHYVYTRPNRVIYRRQLVTYNPGTYYFYGQSPAYLSYRQALIFGLTPRLYLSNGRWTLIIQ